jgi:hypothetical protein
MDNLVQFLRARLKDDEDYARNAYGDHNDAGPEWREQWSGALNIGDDEDLVLTNDSQVSRFMERNDPARILAEVEGKRRILDDVLPTMQADEQRIAGEWGVGSAPVREASDDLLSLLALPYADHPDYRDEWRPQPTS